MYVFANKDPMNEHNIERLAEMSSEENPVAVCKPCFNSSKLNKTSSIKKHFEKDKIPPASLLCRGAKVAIIGKNFEPDWGLFNGSLGTVDEIVFAKNANPNDGDFPLYVAVDSRNIKDPFGTRKIQKLFPFQSSQQSVKKGVVTGHFSH